MMNTLCSFEITMLIYFDSNFKTESSDNGREATPVPIPNTEVKLSSANGTWLETAWESKTLLDSN